jgi:hypothetical protein
MDWTGIRFQLTGFPAIAGIAKTVGFMKTIQLFWRKQFKQLGVYDKNLL